MWRGEVKELPLRHPSQAGDVAVQRPCGLVTGRREQEGRDKGSCREALVVTLGQVGAMEVVSRGSCPLLRVNPHPPWLQGGHPC